MRKEKEGQTWNLVSKEGEEFGGGVGEMLDGDTGKETEVVKGWLTPNFNSSYT